MKHFIIDKLLLRFKISFKHQGVGKVEEEEKIMFLFVPFHFYDMLALGRNKRDFMAGNKFREISLVL